MPTERSGGALVFHVDCHRKVAGNGWDEPCKSRGLRTVLWAAGGEIPPADPATSVAESPIAYIQRRIREITSAAPRAP